MGNLTSTYGCLRSKCIVHWSQTGIFFSCFCPASSWSVRQASPRTLSPWSPTPRAAQIRRLCDGLALGISRCLPRPPLSRISHAFVFHWFHSVSDWYSCWGECGCGYATSWWTTNRRCCAWRCCCSSSRWVQHWMLSMHRGGVLRLA